MTIHSKTLAFSGPNRRTWASGWLLLLLSLFNLETALAVSKVGGIKITATPPIYNPAEQTYESLLTLTNTSQKKSINGPLALLIPATLKKNITLANSAGSIKTKGYIPVPLPSGVLAPQQTLGNIVVAFNNPDAKKFVFAKQVITGLPEPLPVKPNHIPVAKITQEQLVSIDSLIELNGGASTDPEGQPLSYQWTLLEKPQTSSTALTDADQPHTWINIDQSGRYKIKLVVNDGQVNSFPEFIVLDTENSAPVANIDPAIKALKGARMDLSGLNSFDREWDNLTYHWSLPVRPAGSKAKLIPGDQSDTVLPIDKKGSYTARLVVNDGLQNSTPTTVTVSTGNSRPVANAGSDISDHLINELLTLTGDASTDVDNDALTYHWSLLYKPSSSSAQLSKADEKDTDLTPDISGYFIAQLMVNDGVHHSDPDTVEIKAVSASPDNHAPIISSQPPRLSVIAGQSFEYSVTATDQDSDTLNFTLLRAAPGMTINPLSGDISWTTLSTQSGEFQIGVKVSDGRGGSDSQSFTLSVNSTQLIAPDLSGKSLNQALSSLSSSGANAGTISYANHASIPSGYVISQSAAAGSKIDVSSAINLQISNGPSGSHLPPEPAAIAPVVDATTTSTVAAATAFIYNGAQPIQTGVTAETIDAKRAAVIRGKVLDVQNQPLSDVSISILNHTELGQTVSRSNGEFDLVVNGGGSLILNYAKSGLLTVQRQLDVPWQDYTLAPDVVMKALGACPRTQLSTKLS